jgi:hypothetical protein
MEIGFLQDGRRPTCHVRPDETCSAGGTSAGGDLADPLFYRGGVPPGPTPTGRCAAGGAHRFADPYHSYNYDLDYLTLPGEPFPWPGYQPNWRWCWRCTQLFLDGYGPGYCPGVGQHPPATGSFNDHLPLYEWGFRPLSPTFPQPGWR